MTRAKPRLHFASSSCVKHMSFKSSILLLFLAFLLILAPTSAKNKKRKRAAERITVRRINLALGVFPLLRPLDGTLRLTADVNTLVAFRNFFCSRIRI